MQVLDKKTNQVLVSDLEIAKTPWQRFRGLMLRKNFRNGYGLILSPCSSVHTMWMRSAIDIYFISQDTVIVDRRLRVKPWRIAIPSAPCSMVLELPNAAQELEVGTKLSIQHDNGVQVL